MSQLFFHIPHVSANDKLVVCIPIPLQKGLLLRDTPIQIPNHQANQQLTTNPNQLYNHQLTNELPNSHPSNPMNGPFDLGLEGWRQTWKKLNFQHTVAHGSWNDRRCWVCWIVLVGLYWFDWDLSVFFHGFPFLLDFICWLCIHIYIFVYVLFSEDGVCLELGKRPLTRLVVFKTAIS